MSPKPLDLRVHAPARPVRERGAAEEKNEGGEKPRGKWITGLRERGLLDSHGRLLERVWDPFARVWVEPDPEGWD